MAKQKLVNEIKIFGIKGMSEEEIEHRVSSNDLESVIASRGISKETKEAEKTLAEINERHDDIRKLAENIAELTSSFREMSDLVQDQAITIDDIETKVGSASVDVKRGLAALILAHINRDKLLKNRKRLSMILAGILVFFLIIMIVAAATGGEEESEPDYIHVVPETLPDEACDPNTDPFCIG